MCLLNFAICCIKKLSDILILHRVLKDKHRIVFLLVFLSFLLRNLVNLTVNLHSVLTTKNIGVLRIARGLNLIPWTFLVTLLIFAHLRRLPFLLPGLKKVYWLILIQYRYWWFNCAHRQFGCTQIGAVHVQRYLTNFFHELWPWYSDLRWKIALPTCINAFRFIFRIFGVVISPAARIGGHPNPIRRCPFLLAHPQRTLTTLLKFAVSLRFFGRARALDVVGIITILRENVLALYLDVVDLGLQYLLTAQPITCLTIQRFILNNDGCFSTLWRLLLNLDLTLLLVAEYRIVLVRFKWWIILAGCGFRFLHRGIQFLILECKVVLIAHQVGGRWRLCGSHEVKIDFFDDEFLVIEELTDLMPKWKGCSIKYLHVNVYTAFFKLTPEFLFWNRNIQCVYFEVGIPSFQKLDFLRCLERLLLSILNLIDL